MPGHMETFLRLDTYALLREVSDKHDVLNYMAEGNRDFLLRLLEDVLCIFPDVEYFHLGCDEARTIGIHPQTAGFIEKHGKTKLLLRYIQSLANYLKNKGICSLVWHDMFIGCGREDFAPFDCSFEVMVCGDIAMGLISTVACTI